MKTNKQYSTRFNLEEDVMRNIIRISLIYVCMMGMMVVPVSSFAENWWEVEPVSHKTDQMVVVDDKIGENKVVRNAARSNWENGYVEVMVGATADMAETISLAHAYSTALMTARHLAYEKLGETVFGLNLYSDATYDRQLMIDSNLKTALTAKIKNAFVVKEEKKQFNDGSLWVEVTLGMKMYSKYGLIEPSIESVKRHPVKLSPLPEPVTIQEDQDISSAPAEPVKMDGLYTGLIIDATGIGANPAMLPKVLSGNGSVLYGTGKIDKDYIVRYGLMGYQKTVADAKNKDRVGDNPLIIQAIKVKGKNKTDFIVSEKDAQRIKIAAAKTNFLKECRVIAVLN